MIQIRPIRPDESELARRLIYTVAKHVFNDPLPLEEIMAHFDARGTLEEMNDVQRNYFQNGATFLVMTDEDRMIGTGAFRRFQSNVCELKRLWLLPEYHGKGLGYRMMQKLLAIAREKGYERMRLETDPLHQKRAVEFYRKLGFYEIPTPNATDDEDILMEIRL